MGINNYCRNNLKHSLDVQSIHIFEIIKMELYPNEIAKSSLESHSKSFENDDDRFAEIVCKFIGRIDIEVSLYENYGSNISEMQIKVERVENLLNLCIKKVNLLIFFSSLVEHRRDSLRLLFVQKHAHIIEQFAQKCFNRLKFRPHTEFSSDLIECLDILGKYVTTSQKVMCIELSSGETFNCYLIIMLRF